MKRVAPPLIAGVALCALIACSKEVTVYLLPNDGGAGTGGVLPGACSKLGPEVCNGGDDDCDGDVDEGCMQTVTWTRELGDEIIGHASGGVTFLEPCPVGAVLTGLRIGMGMWLNQVQAVCRQLTLSATDAGAAPGLAVTLGSRFDPSIVPTTSNDTTNQVNDLLCPDGLLVSGADGTTTEDGPRYIKGLRITCASPALSTLNGMTTVTFDRAQERTVGPIVCGGCAATQAFNYTRAIAEGRVATGIFGAAGAWVDRLGFDSSRAVVVSKPAP